MTNTKKARLVYLNPDDVGVHDNVRHDLGDISGLTKSIRELGVLVPVTVVRSDGEFPHNVVEGQRRRAAASEAGVTLPALVSDSVDEAVRLGRQLAENLNRKPLTTKEEADAYEQMALLGMSNTAIANAVGVSRKHVADHRKVAASTVASAVADRHNLTLDQLVVLAEFDADKEAVKALTVTAKQDPGRFSHVASRLRQDRDRAEERARLVESLTAGGVTILERASDEAAAVSLRDLTDADDGTPIDAEAHATCPGHAVVLDEWEPNGFRSYCIDPTNHGHRERHRANGQPTPTPMSDEAKAERKLVIEHNKQWRAAEPVRREYVNTLLARRTAPKGTLRYVTEAIVANPERVGDGKEEMVRELVGIESSGDYHRSAAPTMAAEATDARLPLVLLAQVAADCEQRMDVHVWRRPQSYADVGRYLAYLAAAGYGLSEIEQHVVDAMTGEADTPDSSEDDLDDEEDDAA